MHFANLKKGIKAEHHYKKIKKHKTKTAKANYEHSFTENASNIAKKSKSLRCPF